MNADRRDTEHFLPDLCDGPLNFRLWRHICRMQLRPRVGNLRNRVDLLDLTLGTTFEFAQRARLATAVSLPLRGESNRTYDWEFHVQLNWYFGGPRPRSGVPLN